MSFLTRIAAVIALSSAAVATTDAGTLLVANKRDQTLSFIDVRTGVVLKTLPTGVGPHEVEVSPNGRLAVLSMYGTDDAPGETLTVFDIASASELSTFALDRFTRPHGIHWLADNRHVWVTAEFEGSLVKVDVLHGEIVQVVETGQLGSHMIAGAADGRFFYTSNRGSDSVTQYIAATGARIRDLPAGPGAEGIDVGPQGEFVWTGNRRDGTVTALDLESGRRVATLSTGSAPFRLKITTDGRHAVVSNLESGDVSIFDISGRSLLKRIPLPLFMTGPSEEADAADSFPSGILLLPDGKTAYVAHARAREISVLDLERMERTGVLVVGLGPDGMAYSRTDVE